MSNVSIPLTFPKFKLGCFSQIVQSNANADQLITVEIKTAEKAVKNYKVYNCLKQNTEHRVFP